MDNHPLNKKSGSDDVFASVSEYDEDDGWRYILRPLPSPTTPKAKCSPIQKVDDEGLSRSTSSVTNFSALEEDDEPPEETPTEKQAQEKNSPQDNITPAASASTPSDFVTKPIYLSQVTQSKVDIHRTFKIK